MADITGFKTSTGEVQKIDPNVISFGDQTPADGDVLTYKDETIKWVTPTDLSDYYLKTETSGAQEIEEALTLKEDKVFVAEYNVTPYADIKAAYDAGKQIICKFYEDKERWPEFVRLLRLSQYLPMGNCFYFDAQTNDTVNIYVSCGYYNDDTHWTYSNNGFYKKTETSGSEQLTDAFNTKQDKLIPTATQPADTTACSMYVDANGKFYIVTANS